MFSTCETYSHCLFALRCEGTYINIYMCLVLLRQGARKRIKVISTTAHSRCHVTIDEEQLLCCCTSTTGCAEGGTVVVIHMIVLSVAVSYDL